MIRVADEDWMILTSLVRFASEEPEAKGMTPAEIMLAVTMAIRDARVYLEADDGAVN